MWRLMIAAAVLCLFPGFTANWCYAQRTATVAESDNAGLEQDQIVKIFSLQNADAEDMQRIVNELFARPTGRGAHARIRTSFDPRTNSLILIGPARDLSVIEAMVQRLDEPQTSRLPPKGTEIRIPIRSPTDSPLQVDAIVAVGQRVKKGDLLLAIDPTVFEQLTEAHQVQIESARAAVAQDEAALRNLQVQIEAEAIKAKVSTEVATLELKEYQEGTRLVELRTLEQAVQAAAAQLDRTKQIAAGNQSATEAVARAEADFMLARQKLDVFQNFTVPKKLIELESKLALAKHENEQALKATQNSLQTAEAALAARRAGLDYAEKRLSELQQDRERCRIVAPHDGVVADSAVAIQTGSQVREGQTVLILVPNGADGAADR